jgi:hypothetical protein
MGRSGLLSAAVIVAAVLATPALARENHARSWHAENADANAMIGVGPNDWRACYSNRRRALRGEPCGYENRDIWGHWGDYYGPMVHAL